MQGLSAEGSFLGFSSGPTLEVLVTKPEHKPSAVGFPFLSGSFSPLFLLSAFFEHGAIPCKHSKCYIPLPGIMKPVLMNLDFLKTYLKHCMEIKHRGWFVCHEPRRRKRNIKVRENKTAAISEQCPQ